MKKGTEKYFYHYNAHGDVIALTDKNGQVVASYEYDAWGNPLKTEEDTVVNDNPYRYAGYQYDEDTGFYYLIARYYHPTHGVFLSLDPDTGDEDDILTQNGYVYANNNPVKFIDPDGNYRQIIGQLGKILGKYGKKGYKASKSYIKKSWENRKWDVKGPSKDGRIFAVINRRKKANKTTDSRLFGIDYHQIRENKKRTTKKVLHFHWRYKKNKHYFIYPSRKRINWE
ncbi:RHS repeat domain-containing protein [Gottfriedia sp. NPDC058432]|uniref:RHS repeat domain-containing protein n=1 Tax=Gottfriedia sp. NPDC058432 TaxID=3346497 RepID=UPI003654CF6B